MKTEKKAAKIIIYKCIGKCPWSCGQTVLKVGIETIF